MELCISLHLNVGYDQRCDRACVFSVGAVGTGLEKCLSARLLYS